MTCDDARTSIGAMVLGALDPDDQRELDAHLAGCGECRSEWAELSGVATALSILEPGDVDGLSAEPAAVVVPLRGSTRSRAPRRLLAAAAAVVLLAGVGTTAGVLATRGGPATAASRSVVAGAVHFSVVAHAQQRGTELTVAVSGLPTEETCRLIAVARDGSRHPAGTWVATYRGTAQVTGSTDVALTDLRSVVLLGTANQTLAVVGL